MPGRKSCLVGAAALVVAALVPLASGRATGTLTLNARLVILSLPGPCPLGTDASLECFNRSGGGVVPGLGDVSESYVYVVENAQDCAGSFHIGGAKARITVDGKGAIELALAPSLQCYPSALVATQTFTVTGGSGVYAGAAGSGTVQHDSHYTTAGSAGTDTWTGTLVVPGLEFDLTPPTITGAVSKVVRVPRKTRRVRVKYRVAAVDNVDSHVAVSCKPKSGSRFKLGRTKARCSATDSSANTQTAQFTITVRRR